MNSHERILVTGAAGFIGFHLSLRLLKLGYSVVGLDNLNPYYDPNLKLARRTELARFPNFQFEDIDLAARDRMLALFERGQFPLVVHLAAQAGVRNSLKEPHLYGTANLTGFLNVLEGCRNSACRHLI